MRDIHREPDSKELTVSNNRGRGGEWSGLFAAVCTANQSSAGNEIPKIEERRSPLFFFSVFPLFPGSVQDLANTATNSSPSTTQQRQRYRPRVRHGHAPFPTFYHDSFRQSQPLPRNSIALSSASFTHESADSFVYWRQWDQ
jgi:hypothetical protein